MAKRPAPEKEAKTVAGTIMSRTKEKVWMLGTDQRIYIFEAKAYGDIPEGSIVQMYYHEPELNNTQVYAMDLLRPLGGEITSADSSDL